MVKGGHAFMSQKQGVAFKDDTNRWCRAKFNCHAYQNTLALALIRLDHRCL